MSRVQTESEARNCRRQSQSKDPCRRKGWRRGCALHRTMKKGQMMSHNERRPGLAQANLQHCTCWSPRWGCQGSKGPAMHFTRPNRSQAEHKWAEHHSGKQGYLYRDILGCFYRHEANRSKELLVLFTQHLLHHVWKTTLHSGACTMRKKLTDCSEYSWGQPSWCGGGSTCPVRKGWGNCIQLEGLKGKLRVLFQYLRLSRKCSNTL